MTKKNPFSAENLTELEGGAVVFAAAPRVMRRGAMAGNQSELERQADALLQEAAHKPRPSKRSIHINADEETLLAARGAMDQELSEYCARLRTSGDPRGELAEMVDRRDEPAIARFVKRHAILLLGTRPGRNLQIRAWRSGFADHVVLRHDKLAREAFMALLRSPAARFLRRLEVTFIDEHNNDALKLSRGIETLNELVNQLRVVPCRDTLEVARVRSIDPNGQTPNVLAQQRDAPRDALKPLKRIREFRLLFDSA